MAAKSEVVSSGIFLLGLGAGMYAAFCPSLYDVSSPAFTPSREGRELEIRRLRMGEAYASATILVVGAALSVIHRTLLPFFVAVFMVAAFLTGYEYLLHWEG